jgi:H+/Cl- antiporter ClcA
MQFAAWLVFFAVYGALAAYLMCWFSVRRMRHQNDPSRPRVWIPVLAGMICLAVVPPIVEVTVRLHVEEALTKSNLGLAAFMVLWVASFVPGAIKSRRMLQAAGIDPDAST